MNKDFNYITSRGLPGGPNQEITYVTGVFSVEGYRYDSPDKNNSVNLIESGNISMSENDGSPLKKGPLLGIDNLGNKQIMMPGMNYQFPGDIVFETPLAKYGGEALPKAQVGNKEQATLSAYEEPAWYEKVVDYLASPMTAFGYSARNQDLPDRLPINAENRNTFDSVIDIINPFAWYAYAESADRNISEGNYTDAAFDTLGAIPVVPAWLAQGKNVTKAGKNVIKNAAKPIKAEETIFSKYITPKEAAAARAERMLAQESKWQANSNTYTKDKFKNINNNFEEVYANEVGKTPRALGVNTSEKALVFKDNGLSAANQSRVAAHETGHFYRNMADEAIEWNSFFDFSKLKNSTRRYLRGKSGANSNIEKQTKGFDAEKGPPHGDEIRERAAQLKDYIAQKNNIPLNKDFIVTKAQLDDAIKNYVKDTGLDNSMTPMLNSLKDKKGFLNAMNKYALGVTPLVLGAAFLPEFQVGGSTTNPYTIYMNYINGLDDSETAKNIFDKLNRMHYKDAKEQGMGVANYIATNVISAS